VIAKIEREKYVPSITASCGWCSIREVQEKATVFFVEDDFVRIGTRKMLLCSLCGDMLQGVFPTWNALEAAEAENITLRRSPIEGLIERIAPLVEAIVQDLAKERRPGLSLVPEKPTYTAQDVADRVIEAINRSASNPPSKEWMEIRWRIALELRACGCTVPETRYPKDETK